MKTSYTVALSMLAGVALGGAAIQGLHAQSKLKAYGIAEIEVTDASAQPGYRAGLGNLNRAISGVSA
jgi:hypothetical protein